MLKWVAEPPAVLTLAGWGDVGFNGAVFSTYIDSCREGMTAEGNLRNVNFIFPTRSGGEGVTMYTASIIVF